MSAPLPIPPSTEPKVTFLGHSTLIIEMDGTRLLTDPLLRERVTFLRRYPPPLAAAAYAGKFDAVLISHLHYDHLDVRSLSLLGKDVPIFTPPGGASILGAAGFRHVREVRIGDEWWAGSLTVLAVPADHDARRSPFSAIGQESLGYVIEGSASIYFPGDTRLFPEMVRVLDALPGRLDLGLMPVWGWGYNRGKMHMGPREAAEALRLLNPRFAVPIHWGTFAPLGARLLKPDYLVDPPVQFHDWAQKLAPHVHVRTLMPGESFNIER
ncbi:MAG: MBL fold metallo-hydrolase [Chloroflexota bacterium]